MKGFSATGSLTRRVRRADRQDACPEIIKTLVREAESMHL